MKNRIITSEQIESFYRYLCSEERTENTVTKYLRDIAQGAMNEYARRIERLHLISLLVLTHFASGFPSRGSQD